MKNNRTKLKKSKREDLDSYSEKEKERKNSPPKPLFKRTHKRKLRRSDRIQKKRKVSSEEVLSEDSSYDSSYNSSEDSNELISEEKEENIGKIYSLEKTEKTEISKNPISEWNEWETATNIKNYLMDDGFLDVLQHKSSDPLKSDPKYSKEIGKMISSSNNTKSFVSNLLVFGNTFENKVIELLEKDLGINNTINIRGNTNPRSQEKYEETVSAIKRGVPVIFQAIMRNYENKTHGVADILIRSDWINRFLDVNALSKEEVSVKAPFLEANYHYVVIDIKYKTLPLRADGKHLRNDTNMKAYKGQLWIYNMALAQIQGYTPPYTFILGTRWRYTSVGNTYQGDSCFGRLGRIDYTDLDYSYIKKVENALQWRRDVKENNYDISSYPLARDELYPNMCNRHDYPYHDIKKKYAEEHNDLTLLWNVGPKQRRIANENGIYTWKDPRCSPETLGVNGKKRSKVLARILEANRSETRTIYPKYILNNFGDWKNRNGRQMELFVDFETTCTVFNDLDELPVNSGNSLIFLIGAGYIHPTTGQWIFTPFLVNRLSEDEERRICKEFVDFINKLAEEFQVTQAIPCWCFSHAEKSAWNRFQERTSNTYDVEWIDMLKIFLKEPVGIKNCLSYSLKILSKSFYDHGFIQTTYPDTSTSSGADAAVNAYKTNIECIKQNISFADHCMGKEIVQYNEVDVKVMQEILFYLRENHCDLNQPDREDEDDKDVESECEEIVPINRSTKRLKREDDSSNL